MELNSEPRPPTKKTKAPAGGWGQQFVTPTKVVFCSGPESHFSWAKVRAEIKSRELPVTAPFEAGAVQAVSVDGRNDGLRDGDPPRCWWKQLRLLEKLPQPWEGTDAFWATIARRGGVSRATTTSQPPVAAWFWQPHPNATIPLVLLLLAECASSLP